MTAIHCPNEGHGRARLAIAKVSFPDNRHRPSSACSGCTNWLITQALAEGYPILIEPILTAYGKCPTCHAAARLRPSGLISAHLYFYGPCSGRGQQPESEPTHA
jgi:hypothetical protein